MRPIRYPKQIYNVLHNLPLHKLLTLFLKCYHKKWCVLKTYYMLKLCIKFVLSK